MVYRELTIAQGVLFATYTQILTLKEIITDWLGVSKRHLRRSLRDTEMREYELAEGIEAPSLAFIETNVQVLKAMVDNIDEQIKTHAALQ